MRYKRSHKRTKEGEKAKRLLTDRQQKVRGNEEGFGFGVTDAVVASLFLFRYAGKDYGRVLYYMLAFPNPTSYLSETETAEERRALSALG